MLRGPTGGGAWVGRLADPLSSVAALPNKVQEAHREPVGSRMWVRVDVSLWGRFHGCPDAAVSPLHVVVRNPRREPMGSRVWLRSRVGA